MICPETGAPMERGVRPMMITYKDQSLTFDMPGWLRRRKCRGHSW